MFQCQEACASRFACSCESTYAGTDVCILQIIAHTSMNCRYVQATAMCMPDNLDQLGEKATKPTRANGPRWPFQVPPSRRSQNIHMAMRATSSSSYFFRMVRGEVAGIACSKAVRSGNEWFDLLNPSARAVHTCLSPAHHDATASPLFSGRSAGRIVWYPAR